MISEDQNKCPDKEKTMRTPYEVIFESLLWLGGNGELGGLVEDTTDEVIKALCKEGYTVVRDTGVVQPPFAQGSLVRKQKGYKFEGIVLGCVQKHPSEGSEDRPWRVVVQLVNSDGNGDGMLHIFAPDQLTEATP